MVIGNGWAQWDTETAALLYWAEPQDTTYRFFDWEMYDATVDNAYEAYLAVSQTEDAEYAYEVYKDLASLCNDERFVAEMNRVEANRYGRNIYNDGAEQRWDSMLNSKPLPPVHQNTGRKN